MGNPNPMRHSCEADGCYLKRTHAPIELFAGCFGGKIAMSDLDGVVERSGNLLFMEWKVAPSEPTQGQWILLRALARIPKSKVLVVTADVAAEDVGVKTGIWLQIVDKNGVVRPKVRLSIEELRERFARWFEIVNRPAPD